MKLKQAINVLRAEGERFEQLAKDESLRHLLHGDSQAGDHATKCREHLVRAESYKTAATLIAK